MRLLCCLPAGLASAATYDGDSSRSAVQPLVRRENCARQDLLGHPRRGCARRRLPQQAATSETAIEYDPGSRTVGRRGKSHAANRLLDGGGGAALSRISHNNERCARRSTQGVEPDLAGLLYAAV